MAELVFHTGPMDSGKSTLALQMDHAQSAHDRQGVRYAMHDRSGGARITSRIGLSVEAVEVTDSLDLYQDIVSRLSRGGRIDYLICDEAQFYRTKQIDQLARVVDDLDIDVYCFSKVRQHQVKEGRLLIDNSNINQQSQQLIQWV